MSYKWGKNDLCADKFDSIFRVRLKELLDTECSKKYTAEELQESILGCFVHYCLSFQYNLLKDHDFPQLTLPEVLTALASKDQVLLLLDGFDEIAHLINKHHPNHHDYSKIMDTILHYYEHVVMNSRPIYANFESFADSAQLFFQNIQKYKDKISSLVNDNFHIIISNHFANSSC